MTLIRKQSVLIDCRLMMEKPDGIGRYLSQLVPRLVEQAPDLHFHLLRRKEPWAGYRLQDLEAPNTTQHINTTKQMSLKQHFTVPVMVRRLGADLLHYPHYDAPVALASVPVVATIHDLKYLIHPEWYRGNHRLKNVYARWSCARTARRAAALIAVSKYTAEQLQILYPEARTKITVIHEAVDPAFDEVDGTIETRIREKHRLTRPFLLTVGERRPHKNHAGLIRAYATSSARETHDLVMAGSGYADYQEPERLVDDLDLGGCVHFVGEVDECDLRALYREASLFVLVSKHEGFGLPILEAMTCGTPVIASDTTATGEIAGPGAFQVDPDDSGAIASAIDRLLMDEGARVTQIQRGKEWVRSFSWDKAAEETLGVYRSLLPG